MFPSLSSFFLCSTLLRAQLPGVQLSWSSIFLAQLSIEAQFSSLNCLGVQFPALNCLLELNFLRSIDRTLTASVSDVLYPVQTASEVLQTHAMVHTKKKKRYHSY